MFTLLMLLISIQLFAQANKIYGNVGKCPYNTPNVNLEAISGVWFYQRGNYNPYEPKDLCGELNIIKTGKKKIIAMKTSISPKTGKYVYIVEDIRKQKANTGWLNVTHCTVGPGQQIMVLGATNTVMACVYCANNNLLQGTAAEILTRARFPTKRVLKSGYDLLKKFNISTKNIKRFSHKDCFTEPFKSSVSISYNDK